MDKNTEEHNKYYIQKKSLEDDAKRVGWKNLESQEVRFRQLLRSFLIEDGDTVTDLGCGLGDLYVFLRKTYKGVEFNYRGYDIMDDMIKQASKKHTQNNVDFRLISNANEMEVSDFVMASGIFNLKHSVSDEKWLEYIHDTIITMFNKSTKGISFNCLTSFSDKEFMKPELYYSDPMLMFQFCKENLSKNVALYHDYKEFDFTIAVIK